MTVFAPDPNTQRRNALRLVERQQRPIAFDRCIGGHRHDIRLLRPDRRLAQRRAMHLQLGERVRLEALDQHHVDRLHPSQQLRQGGFRPGDLVQQRPTMAAGHQHLMRASLAVAVGVLARPIHVEAMMRVLHRRDAQTLPRAAAAAARRAAWSCRCQTTRRCPAPSRNTFTPALSRGQLALRQATGGWAGGVAQPGGQVVPAGPQRQPGGNPQHHLADNRRPG